MRKILAAGVAAMTVAYSVPAQAAICLEPRAPTMLFIRKPTKPYCATDRSCESWEVESYKASVRRYYQQLEEYLTSVDAFRKQAVEYANCMADLD